MLSIKSTLTFKPVPKDRLFYDRYQYCISFHLDEVSCLRQLDHEYIDTMLERRKMYRDVSRQRWSNGRALNKSTIITSRWKEITEETAEHLHAVCETLITSDMEFKCVVSVNNAWIYTNNIELIDSLRDLPFMFWMNFTEAVITRPKNTLRLKNSKYSHRSYFKLAKLSDTQKTLLVNFFNNQIGYIRLSPGLIKWIESPFHRTQDYFFIDYNEESWLVMLGLIHPGLIRKTVEIEAA